MFEKLAKIFRSERTSSLDQFKALFDRFQQVLEGNNVILELMAQLEDKLSGEYIFDINYLKHAVNELSEEVYRVASNLNIITNNRYPELFSRQVAIHTELENILEGRNLDAGTGLALDYGDIDSDSTEIVGSKNANLGEIRNHLNIPVPDGFALTTYAYKRFMDFNDLWPEIRKIMEASDLEDRDSSERHSRLIENLFARAKLPAELERAVLRSARELLKRRGNGLGLAVRSSAYGEDEEHYTYAGQFRSFLNCREDELIPAYKGVLASRSKYGIMIYNRESAMDENKLPMSVGFQRMIPSRSSGVIYTVDPSGDNVDCLTISAAFGLGLKVVAGTAAIDHFLVSRLSPSKIVNRHIGKKETRIICAARGGVESAPVDKKLRDRPCLSDEQITELAEKALLLDRYFRRPLDIEWSLGEDGKVYILQCRPLKLSRKARIHPAELKDILARKSVIMRKRGQVAQRGVTAGRVRLVSEDDNLDLFPVGAIAVTRYASPRLTSIIRKAAAIITDVGSSTGHMATVAREFGVPMIVNTGEACALLEDGKEITIDAEENVIYEGIIKELLEYEVEGEDVFRELREYKILKRLLRKITPLFLVDPKNPNFTSKNCRTYHDILRFCHEKAVLELTDLNISSRRFRGIKARELKLSVPLGLSIIDLGGGLSRDVQSDTVESAQIESRPLKAIVKGLISPGVWSTQPMNLGFSDFVTSMTRYSMSDRTMEYQGQNLAVISDRYANISLRLGYHFNVIDSYVSDNISDNYIYFRFVGGVTENERRHLRAILIKKILEKLDFTVTVNGDLVIGRLKRWESQMMLDVLEQIGRLIGFSRQLDTQMQNEESVDRFLKEFFQDNKSEA